MTGDVIDHLTDAVIVTDADGVVARTNAAAAELLGRPVEQLAGAAVADLIGPAVERGSREADRISVRGGDGRTRSAEIIRSCSIGSHHLLVLRDVTDRLALATHLGQAQRMEAIGRLAGGVAHDFNNALLSIIGFASMLAEDFEGTPAGEDIAEILAAADRASRLTRQLLTTASRQIVRPHRLDLSVPVHNLTRLLERAVGEDVTIRVAAAPDLPHVLADEAQIEQLLVNLVLNAADAGGTTRAIEIGLAPETLDGETTYPRVPPGRYVALAVADRGRGMDAATRAQMFEPFFTTKDPHQSSGLGLSTVYGIVVQSGGALAVETTEGVGTRVTAYFPVCGDDISEESDDDLRAAAGAGTVLVVEDEEQPRRLVTRILRRAGFVVREAATARAALELVTTSDRYDLLITDVVMPQMDGLELSMHLRRTDPELPALYMTGHTERLLADEIAEVPLTRLLLKPFAPDALLDAARQLIGARPPLDVRRRRLDDRDERTGP